MSLDAFLNKVKTQPESVNFDETIAIIDTFYDYSPTPFSNGDLKNNAGENEGSCKILAFAQLQQLTPEQTLHCFGNYYRQDVLGKPTGSGHQNIRQFMQYGWDGVSFEHDPLAKK